MNLSPNPAAPDNQQADLPDWLAAFPTLAGNAVLAPQAIDAHSHAGQILSPPAQLELIKGAEALLSLGRGENPVQAWLDALPEVARECGEHILSDCLIACMKMSSMTSGEVITRVIETLPQVALQLGDGELLSAYLRFIQQLAGQSARALKPMLSVIDELLAKLSLSGLKHWAAFGTQAYRRDFNKLTAYFALESADSQAMLQKQRRGVLLIRVQRQLNLYLRALWGRDFMLRPLGSDDSRAMIEHGQLRLPDAVDDISIATDRLVAHTSGAADIAASRYTGMANDTGTIAGLELLRAASAHMSAHIIYTCDSLSAEQLNPAQRWFIGLFEDARIEYLAATEFPGVGHLWRNLLRADVLSDRHTAGHSASSTDASATQAAHKPELRRSKTPPPQPLIRATALMLRDPQSRVADPAIAAILDDWQQQIENNAIDNRLSWAHGLRLFHLFAERREVPSLRQLEALSSSYRDDNRYIWQYDPQQPLADRWAQTKQQRHRRVGLMEFINEVDNELADDNAEEIWTCSTELHPYEDDLKTTPSFNQQYGKAAQAAPCHYPEWDYQLQLSRPNWTTLYETRQPYADAKDIDEILRRHKAVSEQIRHIVEHLSPAGVQRLRNRVDGDEIDLNAAVDAMIALRSGAQPNPRVTLRNEIKRRDLAVLVLLDLSQSTNDLLDPTQNDKRTILDLTRESAALLATAIEGIGDSFAIHGFASDGRDQVQYYRFKHFDEHFGAEPRARLAGMQGGLSTRMGAALRHAGHHLSQQPESRRLVLLITDGEPADIDVRDPQYLRHDASKAVDELYSQNVQSYCLTLDPNAERYVERIFGPAHYTIIDQLERLPEKLPALFAALTR